MWENTDQKKGTFYAVNHFDNQRPTVPTNAHNGEVAL